MGNDYVVSFQSSVELPQEQSFNAASSCLQMTSLTFDDDAGLSGKGRKRRLHTACVIFLSITQRLLYNDIEDWELF